MAQPETRLAVLAEPRVLSCPADLHQNELAELFDKYNLHALPVVDAQGRMVGVVQADHVISFLREKFIVFLYNQRDAAFVMSNIAHFGSLYCSQPGIKYVHSSHICETIR